MKVISVPTSLDAESRLDTDSCIEGDLTEIVLSQIEFDELWDTGVFSSLNSELGLMIDEFEDESIPFKDANKAIKILDRYIKKAGKENRHLAELKSLFELAGDRRTGVHFYF